MSALRLRVARWFAMIAVVLVSVACSGAAGQRSPTTSSAASQTSHATPPSASSQASAASPTAAGVSSPDLVSLSAGTHATQVMGSGFYPTYTVVVPAGWYDFGGRFVLKHPDNGKPQPVLGLSVWDVGQVYLDPCHWQGGHADPGPGSRALVAALVAQPMRNATKPTDVTLAGYQGRYLEWSVPATMKSSTWTDFDACDVELSNGHHDFRSWLGNGMGTRYMQVPGQVDRLWVLDVQGQRLVVDATYSPDTTQAERSQLAQVVDSLRFLVHNDGEAPAR
jgi:hypothetical protein